MIICLGPICFPIWHLIPVLILLWSRIKVTALWVFPVPAGRGACARSVCRRHHSLRAHAACLPRAGIHLQHDGLAAASRAQEE